MRSEWSTLQQQAEQAIQRLARLRQRRTLPTESDTQLVTETLEELSVALHELQVSTDELREQSENLATSQESLVAERLRYQELFDFAPDGYVVTDGAGMIREANLMAGAMLSCPPDRLPGRPLPTFWPTTQRGALRKLINRVAKEGHTGVETVETHIVTRDARVTPIVLRVARKKGSAGAELRWILRDVASERKAQEALLAETEQRQHAEASLLESAARYRHLFEHATDLVYELDAAGRFVFCNDRAAQAILGYTERELVELTLADLALPEQRGSLRVFVRRLFQQPGTHSYCEFTVQAKDGRQVWLGQHATVVALPGKSARLQAVGRDISGQIERVETLERSGAQWRDLSGHLQAELESEKTRLAREIHDELGAALTVIRMELLAPEPGAADATPPISGNVADAIRRVDAAIDATRRICGDLRPSLLDNMGLCAAIEWLAQDIQQRAGLRCEATLQGLTEEPENDRATAMFRIVQEAVTNAIRHANASTLRIRQRCSGDDVVIVVSDDGRGIRPEEQAGAKSYGIVGMRERAQSFGGSVQIRGGAKGTRVLLRMPLRP